MIQNPIRIKPLLRRSLHAGRFVPIYPATEGLDAGWIRKLVNDALPRALEEVGDAQPGRHTGFKVELGIRTLADAVMIASERSA